MDGSASTRAPRKFLDKTQIAELLNEYTTGTPVGEIARKFGVAEATVYHKVAAAGLTKRNMKKKRVRTALPAASKPKVEKVDSPYTMMVLQNGHIKVAIEGDQWKLFDEIIKIIKGSLKE